MNIGFRVKSFRLIVCLAFTAGLQQLALSAPLQITITGTVSDLYDGYGVFGSPTLDLRGKPFTLVFTFDDTKGTESIFDCAGTATPYFSSFTAAASNGTATLTINGTSFVFGSRPGMNLAYVARSGPPCGTSQVTVSAGSANDDGQYDEISAGIYPATGTVLTSDYRWNAPFRDSNLVNDPASIVLTIKDLGTGTITNGHLTDIAISVSGGSIAAPLTVTTTTLPNAPSGEPYAQQILGSGGSGLGYVWSLVTGSLPVGFTLTSTGSITSTGSPAAIPGPYRFTIQLRDSAGGTATQVFALVVDAAPITLPTVTMLDPVSALLSGSHITSDRSVLATLGRPVKGIAADGVAQVVLRIPTINQEVTVSGTVLSNCTATDPSTCIVSNSTDEDGGLFNIYSSFTAAAATASDTSDSDTRDAFIAYRAPVDFARPENISSDSALPSRMVYVRLVYSALNAGVIGTQFIPIILIRPPVFLVHGFNTDFHAWDDFAPLVNETNLFAIYNINYGQKLFTPVYGMGSARGGVPTTWQPNTRYNVTSTLPVLNIDDIHQWGRLSHLGFTVSTRIVSRAILGQIQNNFKTGQNPLSLSVAAVNGDVVAHSMGGLVVRNWTVDAANYLSNASYGQGAIHKLITLGTPHWGTPQAVLSLLPQSSCSRNFAAAAGKSLFIQTASISSSTASVSGAAGEMQGDGLGGRMSIPLQAIASSSVTIPIATIAGDVTDLVSDLSIISTGIYAACSPFGDPLASRYTSVAFQTIFDPVLAINPLTPISQTSSTYSDGSVPLTSALMVSNVNSATGCLIGISLEGQCFPSYSHSVGIAAFFSSGNYLQDRSQKVAEEVEQLLNTSIRSQVFMRQ